MLNTRWLWLFCAVSLASITLSSIVTHREQPASPPLYPVKIKTLRSEVIAVGRIVPQTSLPVVSPVTGTIDQIYVQAGMKVKKDQLLFDVLPFEHYQYTEQFNHQTRTTKPTPTSVISVRAPISGTVISLNVVSGLPVCGYSSSCGKTALAVIATMDKIVFDGLISERDSIRVPLNTPMRIRLPAAPNQMMIGTVTMIGRQSVELSGGCQSELMPFKNGFQLRGELTSPLLERVGYQATATMELTSSTNAVVLPLALIVFKDTGAYVAIVQDGDPNPKLVPITLGFSDGEEVEILQGLSSHDSVVNGTTGEFSAVE